MPLLNGKPLKQHSHLKYLRDDDEVFYCKLTNEIFDNYEEFCDRVISCNCMIWNCAITGKSELTYQEALDSEEKALKNIKDFAPELRTPVLYLASLTSATHFSEMSDIVFNFVRNRFFIGETVQVSFDENWSYGQILNVIDPAPEEILSYCEKNGLKHPLSHRTYPPELYKYDVEETLDDDDDENDDVRMIRRTTLPSNHIRRIKGLYSKDKNRAYLKQFTALCKDNIWRVKKPIIDKYAISTIEFSDIFIGQPPNLKLKEYSKLNKSDLKQQSMKKFIVTNMSPNENALIHKNKPNNSSEKLSKKASKKIAKKHKKYDATIERVVLNIEEEKEKEKLRKQENARLVKEAKRQEKEKLDLFAKEWQKKREDLECEDLKELPTPCPIDCRIPNYLFGEFVMVLEFFTCFKDVLKVKDYFPYGLSFDLLERALLEIEVAGPYSDILQLLLSGIFSFQQDEDDEVQRASSGDIILNESPDLSTKEAVQAATLAARWSSTYHNVPLNKLHLDSITVTDILRLHLLSSGAKPREVNARWRFQERGGYESTDDPGLEFRLKEPQILKFLANNCVVSLPIEDKLKVLGCLMTQIVTYASLRDVLDERYEKVFLGRKEIKIDQVLDGKKEKERLKQVKEAREKGEGNIEDDKVAREQEGEKRRAEYQRRLAEFREMAMGYQVVPIGQDRAHRRFWIFTALSGLFVEDDERWPGRCLPQPTIINQKQISGDDEDDTMTYIRKLYEAGHNGTGSDKENEGEGTQILSSPKKKHLAEANGCNLSSPTSSEHKTPIKTDENRMLVCTANEETCPIHNTAIERTKWLFFHKEDEIEELVKGLNKRGYRESALRETLVTEKDRIIKHLVKCPVQKLNRFVPLVHPVMGPKLISTRSVKSYLNANLNYAVGTPVDDILESYLREIILDTEDKIFSGGLGCLKVVNRKIWRDAIAGRSYNSQDPDLTWPTKMVTNQNKNEEDIASRPSTPCSETSHNESAEDGIKIEQIPAVRDLAMALLQVARSLQPKYLQKPLLYEEKRPIKLTVIERWELSLMQCTSFSQVYLHHASLDNSIQWNKSVLNAKCKICRRGKDDINMLLCDGCDRGFHLYCLKPPLNSIPKGDWFCPDCRPKEKVPNQRSSRRRYLQEDDDDTDDEPLVKTRETRKRRQNESFEQPRSKRCRSRSFLN